MIAMLDKSRENNPFWKGGRTISSHGYVRIKLSEHPFADVAGYVYEHRLVMEKVLGRYLNQGEIVHHINGIKTDNRPENLSLAKNIGVHKALHRTREDLQPPESVNPIIQCACGCGKFLLKYDSTRRPRKFVTGHSRRGVVRYDKNDVSVCPCGCGETFPTYDKHGRKRQYINGHNANVDNPNPYAQKHKDK
jgi:hypothetical protein